MGTPAHREFVRQVAQETVERKGGRYKEVKPALVERTFGYILPANKLADLHASIVRNRIRSSDLPAIRSEVMAHLGLRADVDVRAEFSADAEENPDFASAVGRSFDRSLGTIGLGIESDKRDRLKELLSDESYVNELVHSAVDQQAMRRQLDVYTKLGGKDFKKLVSQVRRGDASVADLLHTPKKERKSKRRAGESAPPVQLIIDEAVKRISANLKVPKNARINGVEIPEAATSEGQEAIRRHMAYMLRGELRSLLLLETQQLPGHEEYAERTTLAQKARRGIRKIATSATPWIVGLKGATSAGVFGATAATLFTPPGGIILAGVTAAGIGATTGYVRERAFKHQERERERAIDASVGASKNELVVSAHEIGTDLQSAIASLESTPSERNRDRLAQVLADVEARLLRPHMKRMGKVESNDGALQWMRDKVFGSHDPATNKDLQYISFGSRNIFAARAELLSIVAEATDALERSMDADGLNAQEKIAVSESAAVIAQEALEDNEQEFRTQLEKGAAKRYGRAVITGATFGGALSLAMDVIDYDIPNPFVDKNLEPTLSEGQEVAVQEFRVGSQTMTMEVGYTGRVNFSLDGSTLPPVEFPESVDMSQIHITPNMTGDGFMVYNTDTGRTLVELYADVAEDTEAGMAFYMEDASSVAHTVLDGSIIAAGHMPAALVEVATREQKYQTTGLSEPDERLATQHDYGASVDHQAQITELTAEVVEERRPGIMLRELRNGATELHTNLRELIPQVEAMRAVLEAGKLMTVEHLQTVAELSSAILDVQMDIRRWDSTINTSTYNGPLLYSDIDAKNNGGAMAALVAEAQALNVSQLDTIREDTRQHVLHYFSIDPAGEVMQSLQQIKEHAADQALSPDELKTQLAGLRTSVQELAPAADTVLDPAGLKGIGGSIPDVPTLAAQLEADMRNIELGLDIDRLISYANVRMAVLQEFKQHGVIDDAGTDASATSLKASGSLRAVTWLLESIEAAGGPEALKKDPINMLTALLAPNKKRIRQIVDNAVNGRAIWSTDVEPATRASSARTTGGSGSVAGLLRRGRKRTSTPGSHPPAPEVAPAPAATVAPIPKVESAPKPVKAPAPKVVSAPKVEASAPTVEAETSAEDELLPDAKRYIIESGKGSTSMLQRRLKIGYNRAARLIEALTQEGFLGPANGAKPRELLASAEERAAIVGSAPAPKPVTAPTPKVAPPPKVESAPKPVKAPAPKVAPTPKVAPAPKVEAPKPVVAEVPTVETAAASASRERIQLALQGVMDGKPLSEFMSPVSEQFGLTEVRLAREKLEVLLPLVEQLKHEGDAGKQYVIEQITLPLLAWSKEVRDRLNHNFITEFKAQTSIAEAQQVVRSSPLAWVDSLSDVVEQLEADLPIDAKASTVWKQLQEYYRMAADQYVGLGDSRGFAQLLEHSISMRGNTVSLEEAEAIFVGVPPLGAGAALMRAQAFAGQPRQAMTADVLRLFADMERNTPDVYHYGITTTRQEIIDMLASAKLDRFTTPGVLSLRTSLRVGAVNPDGSFTTQQLYESMTNLKRSLAEHVNTNGLYNDISPEEKAGILVDTGLFTTDAEFPTALKLDEEALRAVLLNGGTLPDSSTTRVAEPQSNKSAAVDAAEPEVSPFDAPDPQGLTAQPPNREVPSDSKIEELLGSDVEQAFGELVEAMEAPATRLNNLAYELQGEYRRMVDLPGDPFIRTIDAFLDTTLNIQEGFRKVGDSQGSDTQEVIQGLGLDIDDVQRFLRNLDDKAGRVARAAGVRTTGLDGFRESISRSQRALSDAIEELSDTIKASQLPEGEEATQPPSAGRTDVEYLFEDDDSESDEW